MELFLNLKFIKIYFIKLLFKKSYKKLLTYSKCTQIPFKYTKIFLKKKFFRDFRENVYHSYECIYLKIKIYEIYNIWHKNLDHIDTISKLSWKIKNLSMTMFRFKQIIRKSVGKYSHMIKCLLLTIRKLKTETRVILITSQQKWNMFLYGKIAIRFASYIV